MVIFAPETMTPLVRGAKVALLKNYSGQRKKERVMEPLFVAPWSFGPIV